MFKANFTFGVHTRHNIIFNNSLSDEYYEKIHERIEIVTDQKIKEIIDQRKFEYALLLRKSDALYISNKPSNLVNGRPIFHTVEDCPVPCSIVYGLRYGSPYLQRLNYILHHLNQGGILQYWTQTDDSHYGHGNALYSGNNQERKPLNTTNLREVFIVTLVGFIISIITFFCEIIIRCFPRFLTRFKMFKIKPT